MLYRVRRHLAGACKSCPKTAAGPSRVTPVVECQRKSKVNDSLIVLGVIGNEWPLNAEIAKGAQVLFRLWVQLYICIRSKIQPIHAD